MSPRKIDARIKNAQNSNNSLHLLEVRQNRTTASSNQSIKTFEQQQFLLCTYLEKSGIADFT